MDNWGCYRNVIDNGLIKKNGVNVVNRIVFSASPWPREPLMITCVRRIQIRDLQIDPPLLMAPMAGLTHSAFRQICSGFGGVGLLSTEMARGKKAAQGKSRFSPNIIRTAIEKPFPIKLLISVDQDVARQSMLFIN